MGEDDLNSLPIGAVGEIVVRALAPGVLFRGYWPDSGSAGVDGGERWHRSGDLGRLDEQGNLTFVDRKVDSIRRRGEMVSSFELEAALLRHPKIAEAAAYGVRLSDEVDGELPYYAAPRFVAVVPELPRTPSGKVVKDELRRRDIGGDGIWDLHALGLELEREHRRAAHPRAVL